MFDSGVSTAGQLHGICGEDYFHMAYMRVWNRTPYSGCPTHSARYRHHLECPFRLKSHLSSIGAVSLVSRPRAVAFWYAQTPDLRHPSREISVACHGAVQVAAD